MTKTHTEHIDTYCDIFELCRSSLFMQLLDNLLWTTKSIIYYLFQNIILELFMYHFYVSSSNSKNRNLWNKYEQNIREFGLFQEHSYLFFLRYQIHSVVIFSFNGHNYILHLSVTTDYIFTILSHLLCLKIYLLERWKESHSYWHGVANSRFRIE